MTLKPSGPLQGLILDVVRRLGIVELRGDRSAAAMAAVSEERTAREQGEAAMATAMAGEVSARTRGDAAQAARQVPLAGTLTLPAGLGILPAAPPRTVNVAGLKANDNITVTPRSPLPGGVSLGEAYCLADGVLTIKLVTAALVTISAKTDIPLGIVALR